MIRKKILFLVLALGFVSLTGLSCNHPTDLFVYKTADSGKNWEQKAQSDSKKSYAQTSVLSVAVDPTNPNNIFVGTNGQGVLRSQNSADTWQQTSLKQGTIYTVAVDPKDSNIVYAGGSLASIGKIYKSVDGGTKFAEIYSETHAKIDVKSILVDHFNDKIVYAGLTSGAFLKSSDSGHSWLANSWFYGPIEAMGMSPLNSKLIYVAVQGRFAYQTKDSGKTWTDLTASLKSFSGANLITAVAFDPKNIKVAYLGSHFGVVKTVDNGKTWQDLGLIIEAGKINSIAMAVSPKTPSTIYVGVDTTIHKSIDGGKNWNVKKITNNAITSLGIDPKNTQNLYLGIQEIKQ